MAKFGEIGEMAKFWRNGEILAKWQNFGEMAKFWRNQ